MNKDDYNNKIMDTLTDPSYEMIRENPTTRLEKEIQIKLKSLYKTKRISKSVYNSIFPRNSKAPIFYGLPKIHKTGTPLRPICDFRNSPSYKIASHLSKILKSFKSIFPANQKPQTPTPSKNGLI
ncbi:hypothetical protein Fcan01_16400 [Folsomia candida]|uniref:Uncharacterized protein n=1 Tax=Folsomia candida TaxID=158441 RepID=A0A226DVF4_FOLCA|nr:hypothetical protein Fcan01_16400 [Folsomia candida]